MMHAARYTQEYTHALSTISLPYTDTLPRAFLLMALFAGDISTRDLTTRFGSTAEIWS